VFLLAKRARIAFQPSAKYSEWAAETLKPGVYGKPCRPRAQITLRNHAGCRLLKLALVLRWAVSATVLSPQTHAPPTSSTLPGRSALE
jgi:hypothetical protein